MCIRHSQTAKKASHVHFHAFKLNHYLSIWYFNAQSVLNTLPITSAMGCNFFFLNLYPCSRQIFYLLHATRQYAKHHQFLDDPINKVSAMLSMIRGHFGSESYLWEEVSSVNLGETVNGWLKIAIRAGLICIKIT